MLKNITLGQYFPMESFLHKADARAKLVISIAILVVIFVAKSFIGYAAIFAVLAVAAAASRVPVIYILKGLKPLIIILILTFILNLLFYPEGRVLISWWRLTVTDEGLMRAVTIAIRLILLLITTTILTLTTSPMELTDALERLLKPLNYIRFPVHEMALMMSIALRFIPTLMEETDRIMKAQTARGASFDTGGPINRAKGLVPVLVPLFVGAFKRADELALAMESRCYNGAKNRTRMRVMKLGGRDIAMAIITAALIAFIALGY